MGMVTVATAMLIRTINNTHVKSNKPARRFCRI